MGNDDRELMRRIASGEGDAFEAFYARHEGAVRRRLLGMLRDAASAEDVLQDVFLRLWTRRAEQAAVRAPKAWLLRIATNAALNHLRLVRRRRERPLSLEANRWEGDGTPADAAAPSWLADAASLGPDVVAEQSERHRALWRLVGELPESKRDVMRLVYEAEMEVREALRRAGLPESGMERLRDGRGGPLLARPSTVGWNYWGRTAHDARGKMRTFATPLPTEAEGASGKAPPAWRAGQAQGEMEYGAMREAGAFENILETYNTRSVFLPDAESLSARIAAGPIAQAPPPTPAFTALTRGLRAAGIAMALAGERVTFGWAAPESPKLSLAMGIAHPWAPERELAELGEAGRTPAWERLAQANARAERVAAGRAPDNLVAKARGDLEKAAREYLDELSREDGSGVTPAQVAVRLWTRVQFSGRSVIAPGDESLRYDQVGLPEEMAWGLYGPLAARRTGDMAAAGARSAKAAAALDDVMARSWIIVNRAPTMWPANLLAFHPVRAAGRAIRMHPMATPLMNGDFDGDQVAVLLPLTDAAQREAGERLSLAGHLRRDPVLIGYVAPYLCSCWGLVELSRTTEGRSEIESLLGVAVAAPAGFLTRASLIDAARRALDNEGAEATLARLERLTWGGFGAARASGASISPFFGASVRGGEPESDSTEDWAGFAEIVAERIASRVDYDDPEMGPQLLSVKAGVRGSIRHLAALAGPFGVVCDAERRIVPLRSGHAAGYRPEDMFLKSIGARRGLRELGLRLSQEESRISQSCQGKGFNVLARAARAHGSGDLPGRQGMVFANAATTGETDPLTDLDSRLFVGLRPLGHGTEA